MKAIEAKDQATIDEYSKILVKSFKRLADGKVTELEEQLNQLVELIYIKGYRAGLEYAQDKIKGTQ